MRKESELPPPGSGTAAPRAGGRGAEESGRPGPAAAEPRGAASPRPRRGAPRPRMPQPGAAGRRAPDAPPPPRTAFYLFSGRGVDTLLDVLGRGQVLLRNEGCAAKAAKKLR